MNNTLTLTKNDCLLRRIFQHICALSFFLFLISCNSQATFNNKSGINPEDFKKLIDGQSTQFIVLKNNNGLEMTVTNYGAKVVSFLVLNKNNMLKNVVLGYSNLDDYLASKNPYLGSPIGRFANRIEHGKFHLNGIPYSLPLNDEINHLNGGEKGIHSVAWESDMLNSNTIEFSYTCKNKVDGYPGNLHITMTYTLTDYNELVISYKAKTDKSTPVNLSHQLLFNLEGTGNSTINDHVLHLNADFYTPTNTEHIPTGEVSPLIGTPLDFTTPTEIGSRIDADFEPIKFNGGYDHNYVLNKDKDTILAASVYAPTSGIFMEVFTTEPATQFYSGNLPGGPLTDNNNEAYTHRSAFSLSPQHFPDSPNKPNFPNTILQPGEQYIHTTIYKFSVR